MKTLVRSLLTLAILQLTLAAKEVKEKAPSGYYTLAEISKAQEKARAGKKLIAVLAKGENDSCPQCSSAMSSGQSAIKSDAVMVFARAENLGSSTSSLPEAMKTGLSGCPTGAAVTFVVFNADLTEVVAKIGRDEINSDKKAVTAFKKSVDAARKKYIAAATPAK